MCITNNSLELGDSPIIAYWLLPLAGRHQEISRRTEGRQISHYDLLMTEQLNYSSISERKLIKTNRKWQYRLTYIFDNLEED